MAPASVALFTARRRRVRPARLGPGERRLPLDRLSRFGSFPWYGRDYEQMRAAVPHWNDIHDLVDYFFRRPMEEASKNIWVEKSPTNVYGMRAFLEVYPKGHGIVVLRDGRDVLCSLMKRGFGLARAASIWVVEAATTLALGKHPRVHLLRYEDLVADPRGTLTGLMDFLKLDASIDQLLNHPGSRRAKADASIRVEAWKNSPQNAISASSVGRWRDELSDFHTFVLENVRLQPGFPGLEAMAGHSGRDMLRAGGYEPSAPKEVDRRALADWLLKEQTVLLGLADHRTFHFRYAPPLGNVAGDGFELLPCLARLSRECSERDETIRRLREELALSQQQFVHADWELRHRIGIRNGAKELLRSTWQAVRGRQAG